MTQTLTDFPFQDRFRDHPTLGFVDWSLRGIGQVVFQNNPLSGLIILLALFFNSWIYGTICILGVVVATAMAMLLKADRGLIRDGLFGFNGVLVALALVAFTSADFRTGAGVEHQLAGARIGKHLIRAK